MTTRNRANKLPRKSRPLKAGQPVHWLILLLTLTLTAVLYIELTRADNLVLDNLHQRDLLQQRDAALKAAVAVIMADQKLLKIMESVIEEQAADLELHHKELKLGPHSHL